MASTIYEQILENLHRGANLPTTTRGSTDSIDGAVEALEEDFLHQLSAAFEGLEPELLNHHALSPDAVRRPSVRATLSRTLREILSDEFGRPSANHASAATRGERHSMLSSS